MVANHLLASSWRIVVASDLHCGHSQAQREDEMPWNAAEFMVQESRKYWSRLGLDALLLLGDFASGGDPQEFRTALTFVEAAKAATRVPADRVGIVPGNHDVYRTHRDPLANYLAFAKEVYRSLEPDQARRMFPFASPDDWGRAAGSDVAKEVVSRLVIDEHRLCFIGVPSVVLDEGRFPKYQWDCGSLDLQHLSEIRPGEHLGRTGWLTCTYTHHDVLGTADYFQSGQTPSLLNPAHSLMSLLANDVDVHLHGHSHAGRVFRYEQLSPALRRSKIVVAGVGAEGAKALPRATAHQYMVLRGRPSPLGGRRTVFFESRRFLPDSGVWKRSASESVEVLI